MARPLLSRIAANDIRELADQHGIVCTPEEIIRLHQAALEIERPGGGDRLDLIGIPIRVGNAWLFRMTVMGSIWCSDLAWPWFRHSETLWTYALAFALAHGRGAPVAGVGLLRDLRDRNQAADAIKAWASRILCTREELIDAIDRVLPPSNKPRALCPTCHQELPLDDDRDASALRPTDWELVIHEIAMATGMDPEYWLTRTSQDACVRAFFRARQILASKCGQTVEGGPDALSEAIKRERAIVAAIVQDRRAQAAAAAAQAATQADAPTAQPLAEANHG